MRKFMLTAALAAAALPLTPAMARQMDGYIVRTTVMRAGPDYDYPAVKRLRRDAAVTVHGCLRDWNWCDVSNRYDRGWVARRDITVSYQGRRRGITAYIGISVLSFSFGNYWDSYYRSRPFYTQRPRWEQHYNDGYRASWGPRPAAPVVRPQPRQPAGGWQQGAGQQGGRQQGQTRPDRRSAPAAPQIVPQQPRPQAAPRPNTPARQHVAPSTGSAGQRQAPGNQGGGDRGNSHAQQNGGQPNRDHKSKD